MVHKKSTYRLMFKNYGAEVRKSVWEENNSVRLRRREEEMSHHSIEQEAESDCECDYSEDEAKEPRKALMKNVSIQSPPEIFHQAVPMTQVEPKKDRPNVPWLHFSPEESYRHQKVAVVENDDTKDTRDASGSQFLMTMTEPVENTRFKDTSDDGRKLGVTGMRSQSQVREYDLMPAVGEESNARPKSASSSKVKLFRSHKYPYTSQLSRTTRKNYHDGDKKIVYLPVGSGEVVRNIGDQTSFNVHLNKDQEMKRSFPTSRLIKQKNNRMRKPERHENFI